MSIYSKALALILGKTQSKVEKLTNSQLEAIAKGKFSIDIKIDENKPKETKSSKKTGDADNMLKLLQKMDSREKGIHLLESSSLSKIDLLQISKALDIPTNNKDNIKLLQDKIIEGTIGYRLRSHAINPRD